MWACAPTLRNSVLPVANAAALPPDPHVGLRALLQDTQQTVRWGYPGDWELQARKGILSLVKRNVQDSNSSQTDSLFETLTISGMRTTRYYKAVWVFNTNASGAVNPPNGSANIRLSAVGAAVSINDPAIRTQGIINQVYTNPGIVVGTIFAVPADGTYQLGCSANSGAASGGTTLTILASGAANEANAANKRAFWVEDMGLR